MAPNKVKLGQPKKTQKTNKIKTHLVAKLEQRITVQFYLCPPSDRPRVPTHTILSLPPTFSQPLFQKTLVPLFQQFLQIRRVFDFKGMFS